ncbi:MAG: aminotransferase class I/II-fold pyridoxal phosphate-dependent enzyme [Xanthomonadales bacterium]|nr:aminotransferase class I/II-fold pyridoxal phosphate-dependent enzyme [Xanthomonadales bacterium]
MQAANIESKLPGFGTTIFTVMTQLANQHKAINLSQGFPDFDGPQLLRDRVSWHMNQGHNQYSPLPGMPALREAIAAKVATLYGAHVDPESQIAVTPGATEALACAIGVTIHAGDEAIIIDPAYDTYDPVIRLNGGMPVHLSMTPDFRIPWDQIEAAIRPQTRLLILNSPHNPSGSAWQEEDIVSLRRVLAGRNIHVLADEVYEHILFDGQEHLGLLRYPDLAARSFVVSSFGKTYHATGWRVGYCIAPAPLMEEFLRIHQFVNFSTNTPMQLGIADFLRDCPEHHEELGAFYQPKRDLFNHLLGDTRFTFTPSAGTYFQLADYSAISDMPDTEFARWLTVEHGVAAVPVSVFYANPPAQQKVRFCFAKDDDTLREAASRLARI